jgi:LysM repeat protein
MKASFRHLAWVCVLLCGNVCGQTSNYTVKPGDSLSKIARTQGCTVEALAKANDIKLSAVIQAGQTLKLPGKATASAAKTTSAGDSHIVQPGDTLSSISRQSGISVEALLAANPDLNPKALQPGQKILLSANAKPAAAKPSATKAEAPKQSDPVRPARTPESSGPSSSEKPTPVAAPAETQTEKPVESLPAPTPQPSEEKVRTVVVDAEMTFSEFATRHGSDIKRLNELNGLDLPGSTILAKGSELYVPAAQP